MGKIKVCDLAKQLNIGSKELVVTLNTLGINSTSHLNVLDDEQQKKVYEYYKKDSKGVDKMATKKVTETKTTTKKDEPRIIRREIVNKINTLKGALNSETRYDIILLNGSWIRYEEMHIR